VVVTEVVPTLDRDLPVFKKFLAAMHELPEDVRVAPCLGALEGYLAGKMAGLALQRCQGPPVPTAFAEALAGLGEFDLGLGSSFTLNAHDHQASHLVWPSVIRGGRITAFEWKDLSQSEGGNGIAHEVEDRTDHR